MFARLCLSVCVTLWGTGKLSRVSPFLRPLTPGFQQTPATPECRTKRVLKMCRRILVRVLFIYLFFGSAHNYSLEWNNAGSKAGSVEEVGRLIQHPINVSPSGKGVWRR